MSINPVSVSKPIIDMVEAIEEPNPFEDIAENTAFVINLAHRVDRWVNVNRNCGHILDLRRIDAVRESPGWIGCYKSHMKLLNEANNRNLNTILVLEDDCKITNIEQFENQWYQIKQWLDANLDKWDIFLGGNLSCIPNIDPKIINYDLKLVQVPMARAAHFIYYNRSCYHQLLTQPMIQPIDWFPINLRMIVSYPYLAYQEVGGYSDVDETNCKYILDEFIHSQNEIQQFLMIHH
jgi:GR25 family glycosyltransferase involved in LPS biosynthesis